ncbi:hypothetical protein [Bacteroides thetaiotaomicron]|uniref:hypothetical protein n=1 Tax=Bacteroides thetaiotaomicron TaxID=818 RepID=UPI0040644B67
MERIESLFTMEDVNEVNAQKVFSDIANDLCKNCCIVQGNVTYEFLEVEFYYWSEKHQDNKTIYDRNKQPITKPLVYKRRNDQPGRFLIHSSGIDICFGTENENCYGGMLIRTLLRTDKDGNKTVVMGPWDCCDAIINYTGGSSDIHTRIIKKEPQNPLVDLKETIRCNLPKGCNFDDKEYGFYNKAYYSKEKDCWKYNDIDLERYDTNTMGIKPMKSIPKSWKPWTRQKNEN